MKKRILSLLIFVTVCCLLTACSSNSIKLTIGEDTGRDTGESISSRDILNNLKQTGDQQYKEIMDSYGKGNLSQDGEEVQNRMFNSLDNVGYNITKNLPGIVVCSVVMGILIMLFSRGNKRIRKWAFFSLVITIPLLALFIVYGGGWLMELFGI